MTYFKQLEILPCRFNYKFLVNRSKIETRELGLVRVTLNLLTISYVHTRVSSIAVDYFHKQMKSLKDMCKPKELNL